jgi:hypothetical protein
VTLAVAVNSSRDRPSLFVATSMRWIVLTTLALVGPAAFPAVADDRASVSLAFTAYSSDPAAVGIRDEAATTTRIDAMWISIQDVRFRPRAACDRSVVPSAFSGPIVAELVRGQIRGPSLDDARLEAGRYCAFELAFRRSRGRTQPELQAVSIAVLGSRSDGVRFVVRCQLETASLLRARDIAGFRIPRGRMNLIVAVDAARWFAGLDLAAADPGSDPRRREIVIDEQSNAELLAIFKTNVASGFALFEDSDGDGRLAQDERARPLASGS